MVLNYIWLAFFLIAFVIAIVKLLVFGDTEVFPAIMASTFDTAKTAFEISLGLTGVLSFSNDSSQKSQKDIPWWATSL